MVNVIIVDDNKCFLRIIYEIVKDYFDKEESKYKIFMFNEFTADFYSTVSNTEVINKILLLDIETKQNNGIEVVRKLRNSGNKDYIILISAFEKEYYKDILRNSLQLYCFISKQENIHDIIFDKLKEIILLISKEHIKINSRNEQYIINKKEIYYIEKEKNQKYSYIVTKSEKIKCYKSLSDLEKKYNLTRSHKSCLVNKDNIKSINNKTIYFRDNISINLLSDKYKKNLNN